MTTYQEYATNEYNKNKKVLKPIDLKEVINVKYTEVIKNFDEAVESLKRLNKLDKKLSTGFKLEMIGIGIRDEGFSIVKSCPHNAPHYAFAIKCLFFCDDELKAFDYWIGCTTKLQVLDAIQYAVSEGFYTNEEITAIIRKILKKHN